MIKKVKPIRTFQARNKGKLEVFEQGKEYKASAIDKEVLKEFKKDFV